MNNNLTEIVFILDRSASMLNLTQETINGFNSLVSKHKTYENAYLTTILFDDRYEVLHDHVEIHQVPKLTENEYYSRGSTALLDAIGQTITLINNRIALTPSEKRPSKVLFTITTDGQENSSHKYTLSDIQQMITFQRNVCNWEFVFLGANIDAIETADSIGISPNRARTYTASHAGTKSVFNFMDKMLNCMHLNDDSDDYFDDEDFFDMASEIE